MLVSGPGISSYIDHTNLKPVSRFAEIVQLCREAVQYGFAAVCVPPFVVDRAVREIKGSSVKIATVIGFPLGYAAAGAKWDECLRAMEDGADELDVVINLLALKNGLWNYLAGEMDPLVAAIHEKGRIIKVIVESGMLSREEIVRCCNLYGNMGIDFMKTSTGYAEKGASVGDVRLMRRELPAQVGIKASGGIRTYGFARELVEAGATRIGCSASLALVAQEKEWFTTEKK
ncbi:MAG: deoxyribose-phosphate aldolase [Bacteroidota bacterium]|nr:deoxyribose-phosphate aldolase [Bacteroidota bacterium]MDP4249797.1 deoxyribose-phosphate aldolase [Bacteroidota bacterium]